MRPHSLLVLACAMLLVTGCGRLLRQTNPAEDLLTAEPLDTTFVVTPHAAGGVSVQANPDPSISQAVWTLIDVPPGKEKYYAALVAQDSMRKCSKLLVRTGIVSRGIDTQLDLATTVLTALSTAFTPLATVHALTAAATISSGWRAVLDADLYAKQTAAIIGTQIDSTYSDRMHSYITELAGSTNVIPAVEVLKIQDIHRLCDIDRALGALAQKAKTPSDDTPLPGKKVLTADDLVVGKPAPAKINGASWVVVDKTARTVSLKRDGSTQTTTFPLDGILIILNAAP